MQIKSKSGFILGTALATVLGVAGVTSQVSAQEGTRDSSPPAEVQRGVPGVDVDLNANRSQGLDVDMQAGNRNDADNGIARTDPDTRTLGAGSDTTVSSDTGGEMRTPIADRG